MEHVFFFDIDGTMLSTGGAGQRAMELALVEEFHIQFPFEGVLTARFGPIVELLTKSLADMNSKTRRTNADVLCSVILNDYLTL